MNNDGQLGGSYQAGLVIGPLVSEADPSGPGISSTVRLSETTSYNNYGQPVKVEDSNGTEFALTYGTSGLATKVVSDPGGVAAVTKFQYDDQGRVQQVISPEGERTRYVYDEWSNVIEQRTAPPYSGTGIGGPIFSLLLTEEDLAEHTHSGCSGRECTYEEIVQELFYDSSGRYIGMSIPKYLASNESHYDDGYSPKLKTKTEYDDSGDVSKVNKRLYRSNNLIQDNTVTLSRDGRERITEIIALRGTRYGQSFTPRGLVAASTRADSQGGELSEVKLEYTKYNELAKKILPVDDDNDGELDFFLFDYDGFGRVTRIDYPDGSHKEIARDDVGRIEQESIFDGQTLLSRVTCQFDSMNRKVKETVDNLAHKLDGSVQPLASGPVQTEFGWGGDGQLLWTNTPHESGDSLVRYTYDSLGRNIGTFYGSGNSPSIQRVLDKEGRVLTETHVYDDDGRLGPESPSEVTWEYAYGVYGYMSDRVDPVLGHEHFTYDARGFLVNMQDASGKVFLYKYDSEGQVIESTEKGVSDRVTSFRYDPDGNMKLVTDPKMNDTRFVHDEFGRLIRKTYEDGSQETWGYDLFDRPLIHSKPGGVSIAYEYDADGRLQSVMATGADANVTRVFGYDRLGRTRQIDETIGTQATTRIEREISSLGKLTFERATSGSSKEYSLEYSKLGNLMSIAYPSGMIVTQEFDSLGRSVGADSNIGGLDVSYSEHYGLSRIRNIDLNVGEFLTEVDYDGRGYVIKKQTLGAGGNELIGGEYLFGATGNLSYRTDVVSGRIDQYQSDEFDRLNLLVEDVGGSGTGRIATWAWDPLDNLIAYSDSLTGESSVATHNTLNQMITNVPQLTGIAYQPSGEEEIRSLGEGGTVVWAWDALGRPISRNDSSSSFGTEFFTYDGNDNLIRVDSGGEVEEYSYLGLKLLGVTSADGTREYVIGSNGDYLWSSHNGIGRYLHTDPFGNIEGIVQSGAVLESYLYDPFGIPRDPVSGAEINKSLAENKLWFQSRPVTAGSGLTSLGPRLYDSSLGRFVSRDPLGESAGPNLYGYAFGNPYRWRDPSGLSPVGGGKDPELQSTAGNYIDIAIGGSLGEVMDWLISAEHIWYEEAGFYFDNNSTDYFDSLATSDKRKVIAVAIQIQNYYLEGRELLLSGDDSIASEWVPTASQAKAIAKGLGELKNVEMLYTYAAGIELAIDLPEVMIATGLQASGVDEELSEDIAFVTSVGTGLGGAGKKGVKLVVEGGKDLLTKGKNVLNGGKEKLLDAGKSLLNKAKNLFGKKGKTPIHMHHLLPQSKKLKAFFESAGLDIEDFKIPLTPAKHILKPDGIHTISGGNWNKVWADFFEVNPNASKGQILDQLSSMRDQFGI